MESKPTWFARASAGLAGARAERTACAACGAAVVLGWFVHDAAVFLASGDPGAIFQLVPGYSAALALGVLLGAALACRPVRLALALVAALAVTTLARSGRVPGALAHIDLARALTCFFAASLLAALLAARLRRALLAWLVAGIAGCVANHAWRRGVLLPHSWVLLGGSAGLLAASWLRPRPLRLAASVLAAVLPFLPVAQRVRTALELPRPDLAPVAARGDRPSLMVIVMDTVRADHLAPYGSVRVTTPELDAFVREHATRFANARSTASWTLPAHASLLTGLMPGEHGADHTRGAPDEHTVVAIRPAQALRADVPTLAERLRAAGYRTGAVLANFAYLDHHFGLDRGFERYDARKGSLVGSYFALPQLAGWRLRAGHTVYRDARSVVDRALAWLAAGEPSQPFFLLLNFMDAHEPCVPPPPFDRAFDAARPSRPLDPERSIAPLVYDRSLAFIDAEIGRLFDWLAERERFERTAIVVCSDHGEAFGEHGRWSHAWTLYDELLRVPLYVKPADGRREVVQEEPVTLAAVYGMALELVGLEPPPPAPGRPDAEWYHPALRFRVRPGQDSGTDLLAWTEGSMKYIVGLGGGVEVYDLASDPSELRALELPPAERDRILARARAWWEAHPPPATRPVALDPEDVERLQALGYAGEERSE
jgi:arylsulfatase A-like enzyme